MWDDAIASYVLCAETVILWENLEYDIQMSYLKWYDGCENMRKKKNSHLIKRKCRGIKIC